MKINLSDLAATCEVVSIETEDEHIAYVHLDDFDVELDNLAEDNTVSTNSLLEFPVFRRYDTYYGYVDDENNVHVYQTKEEALNAFSTDEPGAD